jgi:hypothetical protein
VSIHCHSNLSRCQMSQKSQNKNKEKGASSQPYRPYHVSSGCSAGDGDGFPHGSVQCYVVSKKTRLLYGYAALLSIDPTTGDL